MELYGDLWETFWGQEKKIKYKGPEIGTCQDLHITARR